MLVEDSYSATVDTGFIYLTPIQEIVAVPLTDEIKKEAAGRLTEIRDMINDGLLRQKAPVVFLCAFPLCLGDEIQYFQQAVRA